MRAVRAITLAAVGIALSTPVAAQQIDVQEHRLANGLTLLMVPRRGDPNVAAGWIAKVGSVNERPGITGLSHLFEHMMFKGTRTIGTTDIEADLANMARMDEVKRELAVEARDLQRRVRLGEIADPDDPANRTPRHRELLEELQQLEAVEEQLIVKNEFDQVYTAAGASGMNAGTDNDYTVYFINVPANKLELWFWMESDRLLNPVFREFYSERDVVAEERRLRTDSTPTGKFQEEFDALFWTASPYGWPVVGWSSDLEGISRAEALAYYDRYYAPNNLTACLVGDFDPEEATALADRYFGRLARNPEPPPPVRTREPESLAEKRMIAYAETNPSVDVRYHSVADGHVDEPALVVLGSLLNGRTGRLYKSLVLDQQVATSARAGQNGLKWGGYFSLSGQAKTGRTPEEVEQALYGELDRLRTTLVGDRELQKIKNRYAADMFRRVRSNFGLMIQLLIADGYRGWQSFNDDPERLAAVTAEDIQRVATRYFTPERRAVAVYYRKEPTPSDDGVDLSGLSDEERGQVQQMRATLATMSMDQARQMLERLEAAATQAPPERQKVMTVMRTLLEQRIAGSER